MRGKPGPVDQALSESVLRVGGGIQPGRRRRRSVYHQSDRSRRNQVGIQHLSVDVNLAGNARHQRDHACRRQVPCIKLSGIAVINVVGNGARAAVFLIHTVIVTRQRRPRGAALHGGKPIDTTGFAESIEYGSKQMRIFYAALVISYGYRIVRFYVNGVVVVHRQYVRRPVAAGYADIPNRRSRIQGVQVGLRRNGHRSVRNGAAHFGGIILISADLYHHIGGAQLSRDRIIMGDGARNGVDSCDVFGFFYTETAQSAAVLAVKIDSDSGAAVQIGFEIEINVHIRIVKRICHAVIGIDIAVIIPAVFRNRVVIVVYREIDSVSNSVLFAVRFGIGYSQSACCKRIFAEYGIRNFASVDVSRKRRFHGRYRFADIAHKSSRKGSRQ